jgi:hypothetical protein
MPGDIEMQDASTVVADDEETVQEIEGKGRNCEKVHGCDGFAMITKKCPPALGGFGISGCASHPAGDGSFGNLEAEHAEFTVNARSTPGGVRGNHLENQLAELFGNAFSATHSLPRIAEDGPIPPESRAVPAGHSFRRDEMEPLFPIGPESTSDDPKKLVE